MSVMGNHVAIIMTYHKSDALSGTDKYISHSLGSFTSDLTLTNKKTELTLKLKVVPGEVSDQWHATSLHIAGGMMLPYQDTLSSRFEQLCDQGQFADLHARAPMPVTALDMPAIVAGVLDQVVQEFHIQSAVASTTNKIIARLARIPLAPASAKSHAQTGTAGASASSPFVSGDPTITPSLKDAKHRIVHEDSATSTPMGTPAPGLTPPICFEHTQGNKQSMADMVQDTPQPGEKGHKRCRTGKLMRSGKLPTEIQFIGFRHLAGVVQLAAGCVRFRKRGEKALKALVASIEASFIICTEETARNSTCLPWENGPGWLLKQSYDQGQLRSECENHQRIYPITVTGSCMLRYAHRSANKFTGAARENIGIGQFTIPGLRHGGTTYIGAWEYHHTRAD
ncbi:hypothetical protein OBBRIDRAFT_861738 [Obba rivulosa]|uniref:Uncharacterized protein n=1 Tax=Obba rivulosa TaxID=1052685 RepID=A0A8E2AK81_9APHY|nr:hypothetical protein OBBRIDRAFT_861738 [Obba rivulosa]